MRSNACGSFSPALSPKKRSRPAAWSASQSGEEQSAEQLAEHVDGQQEGGLRGHPARAVERDAAAGHDHVDVRVVGQRRAPGVEHGRDADAGAEVARVGGDRQHGLRRRPEQQVVDRGLVGEGDVGDLGRHREHDVEVADGQQVRLARRQPLARGRALALGAVPVAAGVVGDAGVAAALAGLDVASERRGATGLDGRHHLELAEADVAGLGGAPGRTVPAEDVGDLQRGTRHRIRPRCRRPPSAA